MKNKLKTGKKKIYLHRVKHITVTASDLVIWEIMCADRDQKILKVNFAPKCHIHDSQIIKYVA